jgi:hypothetical protein
VPRTARGRDGFTLKDWADEQRCNLLSDGRKKWRILEFRQGIHSCQVGIAASREGSPSNLAIPDEQSGNSGSLDVLTGLSSQSPAISTACRPRLDGLATTTEGGQIEFTIVRFVSRAAELQCAQVERTVADHEPQIRSQIDNYGICTAGYAYFLPSSQTLTGAELR